MEKLAAIYKGEDTDNLRISMFDGRGWTLNQHIQSMNGRIDPKSGRSPAMCLMNNKLYITYKGSGNDDLFIAAYDGKEWAGDIKISEMPGGISPKSSDEPAAVYFNGSMYLIYRGKGSNEIYYARFDGGKWYGDQKIEIADGAKFRTPQTNHGMDAAVFQNKIWVLYKAADGKDIFWMNFDGSHWYGDVRIKSSSGGRVDPRTEDSNPGLVVFRDRLMALYRGVGNEYIYYLSYDGNTWNGDARIPWPNGSVPLTTQAPRALVFQDRVWAIFKGQGSNELYTLSYDGSSWYGNTPIKVDNEVVKSNKNPELCFMPSVHHDESSWMEGLDSEREISTINLPGTHDSAAISTWRTPYACHNISLTEQFRLGIRIFDIRIQITKTGGNSFRFMTCHGSAGLGFSVNVYQSLDSAFSELEQCLINSRSEFIVMLLRIDDDETKSTDTVAVMNSLANLVDRYPIWPTEPPLKGTAKLKDVRGKIYLINGFDTAKYGAAEDGRIGQSLTWTHNTTGEYIKAVWPRRSFSAWVQDCYDINKSKKMEVYLSAIDRWREGEVFINFASLNYYGTGGYIQSDLLKHWGNLEVAKRPVKLGWTFFDYANMVFQLSDGQQSNIIEFIVSSNFGFTRYPIKFSVVGDGKDEL
ncbi:hypothetical protein ACI2KR_21215 [Pseudomonas luteola]